jgi:deoxyguanosine kinase
MDIYRHTQNVIAVEGSIGAGKSTSARMLGDALGLPVALEKTDEHPFIDAFYSDKRRYGVETEIGFVLLHCHQLKLCDATWLVTDFSIVKDLVFARLSLSHPEMEVFTRVFDWGLECVGRPKLAVFLELEPELLLERIVGRGRTYESGITREFLLQLRTEYEKEMSSLADEVVKVEVERSDSREQVANRITGVVRQWSRNASSAESLF